MTTDEKVNLVKLTCEGTDEKAALAYLNFAAAAVLNRAFPFRPDVTEVPRRYEQTQIEIAIYLLNKRGAEGQISHTENGISRSYESASVPPSMLSGVVPMVGVV